VSGAVFNQLNNTIPVLNQATLPCLKDGITISQAEDIPAAAAVHWYSNPKQAFSNRSEAGLD